jgi:hypothetical protein
VSKTARKTAPDSEDLLIGFLRKQEERMALRLLTWKYEKEDHPLPPHIELEDQAGKLVDEAHRIGKETGQSIVTIIRELVNDLKGR